MSPTDRTPEGPQQDRAGAPPERPAPLLELRPLVERLRIAGLVLAVLALAGAVVEGVVAGLTFAVLIRWSTALVVACLVVAAVLTGLHAYGAASRAQARGERLSGDDVGLLPRRRQPR